MAFSGVRTSWLIRASMSALALAARSASRSRLRNSLSFFLALRQIAEHREEVRAVGPGPPHRHRQRDDAAARARGPAPRGRDRAGWRRRRLDACQIIQHRGLAFRREQIGEIALHEFVAVIAEQRFGAAIAGIDVAFGVEHHDAFGRGVEDGAEFLGIGVADRRGSVGGATGSAIASGIGDATLRPRRRARADQRQRGIAVPRNRMEMRLGRPASAPVRRRLARRNRHRRAGIRRAAGAGDAGFDVERVEAAGLLQRVQAVIADPLQKRRLA